MQTVLDTDPRPPILLLRAFFRDDDVLAWDFTGLGGGVASAEKWFRSQGLMSFEEKLVAELRHHGPVVALGRPGEILPPLGAARLYVGDDHWQDQVKEIAARALFFVVIADDTASLRWELSLIVSRRALSYCIGYVESADR